MTSIIMTVLTPVAVYVATAIAKAVIPALKSWKVLTIAVPLLSALYTVVTNATAGTDVAWYFQVLLGFGAVLLAELVNDFKNAMNGA